MSALPPKADIRQRFEHVCFVPQADIAAVLLAQSMARGVRPSASIELVRCGTWAAATKLI